MKKNTYLLFLFLFIIKYCDSQTATSVTNGNWTNPLTWNCTCVPTPGYTVIVNHNIILNTSFGYTSGGITINSGASLVGDAVGRDVLINGGALNNYGTLELRFLAALTGTISNSGSVTLTAFANNINFFNTGVFQNIDSMTNNAIITNNNKFINIDSITNNGIITNNGVIKYNQFTNNGTYTNNNSLTFQDLTNNGTITNVDSIECLHSVWNQGKINNMQFSFFQLDKSLLNKNFINGTACVNNNGEFIILDSYYNYDTIKGVSGEMEVQDSSVNYGSMLQSFDFCDHTPPAVAPFVDFNFGTIGAGITWCLSSGIVINSFLDIVIYPNPSVDRLFISIDDSDDFEIIIYDIVGAKKSNYNNVKEIDVSEFDSGIYFLAIQYRGTQYVKKVLIEK